MTAPVSDAEIEVRRTRAAGPVGRRSRRAWLVGSAVVLVWSLAAAGIGRRPVVNTAGWSQVADFFGAALRPETSAEFLRLTWDAARTTIAYALLGTLLAVVVGVVLGIVLSETWWNGDRLGRHAGWIAARGALALPRGVHEAVWGLFLVQVLGLDPLVAVLAIGIPFGTVTAKVVAEIVDESAGPPLRALRAAGAGRLAAVAYGCLPLAAPDIVSYAFYRFECAIRAAAILGIIGAGGLGFQLSLSFQALRYEEMWTLLYALAAVSGLADLWSARVRGRSARTGRRTVVASLALAGALTALSFAHLHVDVTTLWSARTRLLFGRVADAAWPVHLPDGGAGELARLSVETLQMSVIAIVTATAIAVPAAFLAARGRRGAFATRLALLLVRAVPPPVWAFIALFVLFPGSLPGALALGLYNAGILGRLMAEVVENLDPRPADALRAAGAPAPHAFLYAVLPQAVPRFAAYALYRWEVAVRETVIVGLVGAGGLGRLLADQVASFDHGGALATIGTLIGLTFVVDLVSAGFRSALR